METRSMKKKRMELNHCQSPDEWKLMEFMDFLLRNKNVWTEEKLAKVLESSDIALTEEVTILSESVLNRK